MLRTQSWIFRVPILSPKCRSPPSRLSWMGSWEDRAGGIANSLGGGEEGRKELMMERRKEGVIYHSSLSQWFLILKNY